MGDAWRSAVADHRNRIEEAPAPESFEEAVTALLQTLKTSHVGFFHQRARRASSRAALSATYLADETTRGSRWIFQDVHDGGAAALAGIKSGDVLLNVNDKEIIPPEHPVFPMGVKSRLALVGNDDRERSLTVDVSKPKGKKLQFIEPTLVQSKKLLERIGYLKVAMFPGMIGVEVANEISAAIESLGEIHGLIIDLRGNTGGGAGALRLMSLLTPEKIPVGYAPSKRWAERDLAKEKVNFPRFGKIPGSKGCSLCRLLIKYLPSLLRQNPRLLLETRGAFRPKIRIRRNVVLLVG